MTPLALRLWRSPLPRHDRDVIGNFLSGAQFFDCTALQPIIDVRSNSEDTEWVLEELISCELPAEKTWIQIGDYRAMAISDAPGMKAPAERFACLAVSDGNDAVIATEFRLLRDGTMRAFDQRVTGDENWRRWITRGIRSTWFAIEAMQTPGGLCHQVNRGATRQQLRQQTRTGAPIHKWVEIRLGRERRDLSRGDSAGPYRTVAWHYRRGHRVNHPNPNYPKWRKGCWVGSPDAGIRSHNYIVEVPA